MVRANATSAVVPANAGTHTARNRVSAMKRKSFATSNARGVATSNARSDGSLLSQGRLGREFVDHFNKPRRHCEATDRANAISAVVPANAGTHTARNRVSAMKRTSFLQPAMPGVMGPCFRRDDLAESLSIISTSHAVTRANGSRECAPDGRLREVIQIPTRKQEWIASLRSQ
jgi:hypothetical protein